MPSQAVALVCTTVLKPSLDRSTDVFTAMIVGGVAVMRACSSAMGH